MEKKEKIALWKYFVIIFAIIFFIINWEEIFLVFNYRVLQYKALHLFNKEEEVDKENSIEIPKININAPLIVPEKKDLKSSEEYLDKGVLLYFDSALPGQKGLTIILGHSAPANWPDINYDNVFSNLDSLEQDDEIIIYYNKKKYSYKVIDEKIFLPEQEEEILSDYKKPDKSYLVLITCWPPGKDYKRLTVIAVK